LFVCQKQNTYTYFSEFSWFKKSSFFITDELIEVIANIPFSKLIHFVWNITKLRQKQMGTALTKLMDSAHSRALETVTIGPDKNLYIYYQQLEKNEQSYMNISNKVGVV
jgi:hypothetical protein